MQTNHSTIFKTINGSVDKTRKSLALFNKDWNTYKTNWQNANGILGKIGSVFSTAASPISSSDIQAIKEYNSQINSCVTSQTAFNRTMLKASPIAQNMVASYNGAIVPIEQLTHATATMSLKAKAGQVAIGALKTALNAIAFTIIIEGISRVVNRLNELSNAAKNATEKGQEFASSLKGVLRMNQKTYLKSLN